MLRATVAPMVFLGMFASVSPVLAQTAVADFYRGKTITIFVGSSPGGGYDLYGRLIGRYLGKHVPGNPGVIVQNMPGAASNVAAAYVYNVAPMKIAPTAVPSLGATL